MIESRNISGDTAVVIFPYLKNPLNSFVNKDINTNLEQFENPYLKHLVIANTHSTSSTVSLSVFDKTESDGTEVENDYYILKDTVIPVGSSITLNADELCLFDLLEYGLKLKLSGGSENVSAIYKIIGYVKLKSTNRRLVNGTLKGY
tara:strand:+ start:3085 stop:3525 length:441 start_codon:yes stop_codon:yes gene_type:complete